MARVSKAIVACLVGLASGGGAVRADSSVTTERRATPLAEGVYVIRHPDAPDTFPQSNTTVIVGNDAVLVVDSCYLPSAAREDIAQIRRWTTKPVRYLLNTHWHYDHTMGNAAYRDAFPGLSVIAHTETRNQIAGYNPGWFTRYPDRGKQFQAAIDSGKDPSGRTLSASEIDEYRSALRGLGPVGKEYAESQKRLEALTPDTAFEQELRLDLGGREVRILFLGRGNTAGDAIAFLPKERIVAAGDLVVHPVPYLGGGYPTEFPTALRRLKELEPVTIVPGHGDVLQGTEYVNRVAGFISTVVARVGQEINRLGNSPRTLDEVQKVVEKHPDVLAWRQRFALDDAGSRDTFDGFSLPGVIRAAHAELVRR